MKAVLTATEIARLGIPGIDQGSPEELIGSERHIRRIAQRDRWLFQDRPGRGGGRAYPISALPEPWRNRLLDAVNRGDPTACAVMGVPVPEAKPAALPATVAPAAPAASEPTTLSDWQRRTMEARAALLVHIEQQVQRGAKRSAAVDALITAAGNGTLDPCLAALIPVANARSGKGAGTRTLSARTYYHWLAEARAPGATMATLAPRDARKPAEVPAWAPYFLAAYRQPQQPSVPGAIETMAKTLPPAVPLPTPAQARYFLKQVSYVDRHKGRMGPNALLAAKGFRRRDTSVLDPLDVVVADGHTFKADIAHPAHGKPFGPEVMALQDRATRFVFGWSAGIAESTWVVMDAIRHGVSRLGMFAIFYTDNGSGFVNQCMGDEVVGFLGRLGATHQRATPHRAQARGGIERLQQSLWVRSARQLVTYRGKDMDRDARKKVVKLVEKDLRVNGSSKLLMSWTDFLVWCQQQVDAYNARPHRSLPKVRDAETGKMRHQSPAENLQSWRDRGWQPVTLSDGELADLFRPYEVRTTFRGEVVLPWGRYYHADLVDHGKERVRVGYDIHDGSQVWVRTIDGMLICVARREGNACPDMPASLVEHSRNQRAAGRLRLIHQKEADALIEQRGPGMLIEVGADPTPEQHARAERLLADLEASARHSLPAPMPVIDVVDEAAIAAPAGPEPTERPRFSNEFDWARAVMTNPPWAQESDRRLLAAKLGQPAFRLALGLDEDDEGEVAAG